MYMVAPPIVMRIPPKRYNTQLKWLAYGKTIEEGNLLVIDSWKQSSRCHNYRCEKNYVREKPNCSHECRVSMYKREIDRYVVEGHEHVDRTSSNTHVEQY